MEIERYCYQHHDIWESRSENKNQIMTWRTKNKFCIDLLVVKDDEGIQATIDIYKK